MGPRGVLLLSELGHEPTGKETMARGGFKRPLTSLVAQKLRPSPRNASFLFKNEAQREEVTGPRSLSQLAAEP